MKRYHDYDAFAWLYNREWAFFGERIFPGLKAIAGDSLPEGARILDLCCGTGQLAKALVEKGYRVTGIDGSAEMLRYSRKNAPTAEFILSDARAFKLLAKYNAVFSTFDSLNHVMSLEELEKVFNSVFNCLAKRGIFIFDMTTKYHFEVLAKNIKEIREKPEYLYMMRTEYDAEKKRDKITITIFQSEGNLWNRSDTVLYQTWYPCKEVKSALEKAGFAGIRAHAFTPQRQLIEGTDDTDRIFYYARKP